MPETPICLLVAMHNAPKPLEQHFQCWLRTVPALKNEGNDFKKF